MKLAKPTNVIRIDPELLAVLKEMSQEADITLVDASRILARKTKSNVKRERISWNII